MKKIVAGFIARKDGERFKVWVRLKGGELMALSGPNRAMTLFAMRRALAK